MASGSGTDGVAERARAHYDPSLPYHCWDHAVRAAAHGAALVERCAAQGVAVDGEVVRAALLFHDAGYRVDPVRAGCSTREEHSAAIAAFELSALGLPLAFVSAVVGCVLATEAGAVPTTPEQQVVRAADLAEVAGDYERFVANSEALRAEAGLLSGAVPSPARWRGITARALARYLAQDIRLTALHDAPDGVSEWHRRALGNVARYLAEDVPEPAPGG